MTTIPSSATIITLEDPTEIQEQIKQLKILVDNLIINVNITDTMCNCNTEEDLIIMFNTEYKNNVKQFLIYNNLLIKLLIYYYYKRGMNKLYLSFKSK